MKKISIEAFEEGSRCFFVAGSIVVLIPRKKGHVSYHVHELSGRACYCGESTVDRAKRAAIKEALDYRKHRRNKQLFERAIKELLKSYEKD